MANRLKTVIKPNNSLQDHMASLLTMYSGVEMSEATSEIALVLYYFLIHSKTKIARYVI